MEIKSPWEIDDNLIEWMIKNIKYGSSILELGSGVGTLKLKKHWEVTSIEHDPAYLNIIDHKYIYAPLKKHKPLCNYPSDDLWYDRTVLRENLLDLQYDILLVDGPPSPNRVGLIKYWTLFNPNIMWVFDDLHRDQERKLVHGISRRLKREYIVYNAEEKQGSRPFGVIYPVK